MENVVLDKAGRFVLPKKVRKEFDTNLFDVVIEQRKEKKRIVLEPREGLAALFGKAPEVDVKEFDRQRREELKRERIP